MKKIPLIFAIPTGIAVVMALLIAFGGTGPLEHRMFDISLGWHPSPPEDKNIVLVEFDDEAVSAVGTWPVSRSITADGLLLLRELGSRYAVFDIEYVNKSPRGVNASILEETFPSQLKEQIGSLADLNSDMAQALKSRQFPVSEAPHLAEDFRNLTKQKADELVGSLQKIAIDNDERLAHAASVFGNAFLTVRLLVGEDTSVTDELRTTAVKRHAIQGVEGVDHLPAAVDISPTIEPILGAAKGLGFTNVTVDPDGVRRRVDLMGGYEGNAFAQLAFSPYLDLVGRPQVTVRPDAYVLKGATYPDGSHRDLTIPRAQDGTVLINWPHATFLKTYRHLSFYYLYQHDKLFNDLVHNLKSRDSWGYLTLYQGQASLLDQAKAVDNLRTALLDGEAPPSNLDDYRAARAAFLVEVGKYLDAQPEVVLGAELKKVLADPGLTDAQRTEYKTIEDDLPDWTNKTRTIYTTLMDLRTSADKLGALEGSYCILGNTNTGSTDLGVTPFENNYPNVGTHASVLNMLLQRNFITDASPWWSWILGLVGALALTFYLRGKKPVISLSVGGGVTLAAVVLFVLFFSATGIYLPIVPLAALMLLTFLGTTFFEFLKSENDKSFLRNAFSRYLSNEVVQQIIANPDQLKLGGQQKNMTAMFTDIKGFSTISEKLNPEQLVYMLNIYLTKMSDLILDLGGTIDKYEGDAIIAFFGAPIDLDDHAKLACQAAVRMKRVEESLNEEFLSGQLAPSPLLTRIGINTGPMVVGNMGTDRKMNYTIIGDSVNLAARLEGVNKVYGSWILISEDTRNLIGDALVVRMLDRVRVVGKSQPIRLFQVLEEKGHVSHDMEVMLVEYHKALEAYEGRRWEEARQGFERCLDLFPNDYPSNLYLKRTLDYQKAPPAADWDGVENMTSK